MKDIIMLFGMIVLVIVTGIVLYSLRSIFPVIAIVGAIAFIYIGTRNDK